MVPLTSFELLIRIYHHPLSHLYSHINYVDAVTTGEDGGQNKLKEKFSNVIGSLHSSINVLDSMGSIRKSLEGSVESSADNIVTQL